MKGYKALNGIDESSFNITIVHEGRWIRGFYGREMKDFINISLSSLWDIKMDRLVFISGLEYNNMEWGNVQVTCIDDLKKLFKVLDVWFDIKFDWYYNEKLYERFFSV